MIDEPNYPAAEFNTTPHLLYALRASIAAPKPLEDINYPLISEFLFEHRTSLCRFSLYPQLAAKWKPRKRKDQRKEIPDMGVGFFYSQHPFFKLRFGVESKRILSLMMALPKPEAIEDEQFVKVAFQDAYLQGEDQAKALIKNGYHTDPHNTLPYLLFIGPYWTPVTYGPFSEDELSVCTNISESADWKASDTL